METKIEKNSIEKLICEPFEKLHRFPMNDELSKIMIQLMLSDVNIPEDERPFLYQLIEKRIKHCFSYEINDPKLILFLCILTETPGNAIMYLTYLQYWCKKNDVKELTFHNFCSEIFPVGFPSEDDLQKLWDSQKVNVGGSDNLLDHQLALESIQF